MPTFIGIDPGSSGGVAWIDDRAQVLGLWKLKTMSVHDIVSCLAGIKDRDADVQAVLEKVGAMPGDGKRKMGAVSAFTFGKNVGQLEAALAAAKIPFWLVTPRKWRSGVGLAHKKDESRVDRKNRNKALAQQLFPDQKVIHAVADALLLAEYARTCNGQTR